MRVLTVRQPWAWAIINGGKDVENRTRNIVGAYRGPVAIHAAKRTADFTDEQADFLTGRIPSGEGSDHHYPLGAIIGVVDVVDSHLADSAECYYCSDWAEAFGWHLILANPRAIDPIPAKGRLGLWNPDLALARALDEHVLWQRVLSGEFPRVAGAALGIAPKRVDYLCTKWTKQGRYDWGTSVDLGWAVNK